MRYAHKRNILYCALIIGALIVFLHPDMNAKGSYEYIKKDNIPENLYEATSNNLTTTAFSECDYQDILDDETILPISLVDGDLVEGHRITEGGEYVPIDCKPKFSTAIIVPYRDRAEQLRRFLVYMHTFLRRQHIHYKIYVIEQVDSQLFNLAKLINVGAKAAMHAGFPCLVLHDVDLLPLRPANLYACTKLPRHMSSNINKYRFVLPSLNVFGGVIAIIAKQFKTVNGMSNEYFGSSGEYDDLYKRLKENQIKVCRFEPTTSGYHMVSHQSDGKQSQWREVSRTKTRREIDGLNTLKYVEVATVLHPLFTHIMVDL